MTTHDTIPRPDLAALIAALRARATQLRPHVRPSPVGTPPLPWRSDPVVAALEALDAAAQRAAIATLLGDDDPLTRAIGVHLIIAGEHRELLPDAVARLGALAPTAQAGVLDEEDAHAADSYEILATMVVVAIGRLQGREHIALLREALDHAATFWAAVESLALLGGETVLEDLQRAIDRHTDPWDRLDVVKVIGDLGGAYAVPVLLRLLDDRAEAFAPLRGYAAQALGTRGGPGVAEALIAALHEPTMLEKGRVLWALWRLADASTFDAIAPWLEPDAARKAWWRAEALKALAASDRERAHARVLEVVRCDAFFRTDREAWADAMRALGHLGSEAARAVLIDTLRANLGLAPAALLEGFTVPGWVATAGPRLAAVLLTALGESYGVDLTPRTAERRSTADLVAAQRRQLAAAIAERALEVPEALLEALA